MAEKSKTSAETAEEFSCREVTFDGANDEARCRCRGAAMRAYGGMKDHGSSEHEAVDAAYRVYRFHHPQDSKDDARLTVERWIYSARAH